MFAYKLQIIKQYLPQNYKSKCCLQITDNKSILTSKLYNKMFAYKLQIINQYLPPNYTSKCFLTNYR